MSADRACPSLEDKSFFTYEVNTDGEYELTVVTTNTVGGGTATVKKLTGEGALKRRIMDMGITKGTQIYVRKVAPLGDPIEINLRGYELTLRKADAEMIEVE